MIPNHFKTTRDFQIFLPSLPSCEVSTSSIPWSQIQSAKNGVNKCLPLPLTSSSHRRLLNPLLVSASLSPNKDIMEHPQVNAGEWNYGLRNKSAHQRTWTDATARKSCNLHRRIWEHLILSLKVTFCIQIGMLWWRHREDLLLLSRVASTLSRAICLPFNIIRQSRLVFSLVLTTAN